jgi:Domain of unknown function (DUF1707)
VKIMPTQPGPSWQRNFEALFHGSYPDQNLRVSDTERQAVADRLAEHFSEGRLDQSEFDERVGQAMGAKTRADLSGLFTDLPETAKPAPSTLPDVRRRRHGHPVLLIALLVIVAIAAAHAVAAVTLPFLWIGFVVLAIVFITRNARHTHSHHQSRANQEQ